LLNLQDLETIHHTEKGSFMCFAMIARSKFLIFLLSSSVVFFSYAMEQNQAFHMLLMDNPIEASQQLSKQVVQFYNEMKAVDPKKTLPIRQYATGMINLLKKYEQEHPLFLVTECGSKYCSLSRTNNPHLRETFKTRTSSMLLNALTTHQRPITYTSFGCGGALSELIIMSRVLAQQPTAQLNIHFIDRRFTDAVEHRKAVQKLHQIHPNDCAELDTISQQIVCYASIDEDIKIKKARIYNILYVEYQAKLFLSWLQRQFPLATVSLFMHSTTDNYCNYLVQHTLNHADIIASIDIQDETSRSHNSGYFYAMLCKKTLEANPQSQNIIVDIIIPASDDTQENQIQEHALITLYLNKAKKRRPVPLINGKVIYVTQEKI
jgi:hypothetical protein